MNLPAFHFHNHNRYGFEAPLEKTTLEVIPLHLTLHSWESHLPNTELTSLQYALHPPPTPPAPPSKLTRLSRNTLAKHKSKRE